MSSTAKALRRAWEYGYDCAISNPEISYWVRPAQEAELLTASERRGADLEDPAGWSAWLMGFATGLLDPQLASTPDYRRAMLSVGAVHVEKMAKLEE